MTAPIRQRVPLAASDEQVIVRRGAARHDRCERRRHVQPRHAHGLILGAYQRAVILAPCPASGLRRGTVCRESR
jgi:hypothetical protein